MSRDYSHPYIMDLDQMNLKMDGTHPLFPEEAIPTPKLKEIIREFTRLHGHCDDARDLCEYNVGQIIKGGTVLPYPSIDVPS